MAGSGVLRKQYKALAELVGDFGVEFDTPSGSFNQKFCALCKLAIDDLGGTFTPVKGGDFTARKASYLWQLAKALGLSIEDRQGSANLMLASAKTIFNDYNDGTRPDIGSSLDWRVFQYLNHAIGGPPVDDLIQYVLKEYHDATDKEWPDSSGLDNVILNTESNCITLNGADQNLYLVAGDSDTYFGACTICGWVNITCTATCVFWAYGDSAYRAFATSSGELRIVSQATGVYPFVDGEWAFLEIDYNASGEGTEVRVDGTTVWTGNSGAGSASGTYTMWFGAFGSVGAGGPLNGSMCDLGITGDNGGDWPCGEGDGTTCHDVSGNGNDLTLTLGSGSTTVMWSGTQDEYHYNLLYGCSPVTTDDVTLYYPALSDGSDDVAGLGLTNPAGNWHNGAETYFIQDDANSSSAELLTRAIFSADEATFDAFDFDEMWDYVNGTDNVFFLRKTISSAQRISVILVYAYDKQFTVSEWARLQAFLSSDEGDSLVPAEVTAGTGIGPDLDWADNGDGEILLVTET